MKSVIGVLFFAVNAQAFVPTGHRANFGAVSSSTALSAESASEAIKAALEASKTHGATSKEARVAWDIVEEINASDNSAAFKGGITDEELLTDSARAKEYKQKVDALAKILDDQKAQIEAVKDLATKIRAVKLVQPETTPQPVSDAMVSALEEAKQASIEFGSDSVEAKLAWETVEDIAQDDSSEAMKMDLSDECLIETIDACEAIEEMQRALHVNENVGSGRYQG